MKPFLAKIWTFWPAAREISRRISSGISILKSFSTTAWDMASNLPSSSVYRDNPRTQLLSVAVHVRSCSSVFPSPHVEERPQLGQHLVEVGAAELAAVGLLGGLADPLALVGGEGGE